MRAQRKREQAQLNKQDPFSYSQRVTVAFALTGLMTAVILASILWVVWEGQFMTYTRDNMEQVAKTTAVTVARSYAREGEFTEETITQVASIAQVQTGVAIQLTDAEGTVLFDDAVVSEEGGDAGWDDANKVVEQAVLVELRRVGTVRVKSGGANASLTQADAAFRASSYRAVLLAAVLATIIAAIVGFVYAKGLVRPVKKVTRAAERVKGGDLTARTGLVGDDEISQLGETFDAMVASIEKDRELERRLTTDVAHELRTPLMAIQATVEAIRDGVLPADDERMATIDSETRRLSRLVSAILKLSRLESGSSPFDFQTIDLGALIGELVESQQPLFEASDMELSYACDSGLMVECDPDKLRQATVNLISNAVRYTDVGGHVSVEVRRAGTDEVSIIVSDDGIGIAEEDLQRVFSRFWRADEARDRESGGLGVGLAVVNEIINRHHGHVDVASKLGVGTTFYLYIPVEQPSPDGSKRKRPTSEKKAAKQQKAAQAKAAKQEARAAKAKKSAEARVVREQKAVDRRTARAQERSKRASEKDKRRKKRRHEDEKNDS